MPKKHKENRKPHEDKAIKWTGRIDQIKSKIMMKKHHLG